MSEAQTAQASAPVAQGTISGSEAAVIMADKAPAPAPEKAEAKGQPIAKLGDKLGKDAAYQRAIKALERMNAGKAEEAPEATEPTPKVNAEGEAAEGEKPAEEAAPVQAKELESDKWAEAVRARRKAEKEAKARAAELEAKQREYETRAKEVEPLVKAQELLKKGDALGALGVLGVDYSKLTADVLAGPPKADPAAEVRAELESLKAALEAQRKEAQAREFHEMRRGVEVTVRAELADVAGIEALKSVPGWESELVDAMEQEWRSGNEITPAEAARIINDRYRADRIEETSRLIQADPEFRKHILSLVSQKPTNQNPPQATKGQTGSGNGAAPKTLSSAHAGDTARLTPTADPKEARRRAIAVAEQMFKAK